MKNLSLISILKEILEASLTKDYAVETKAQSYIDYVKKQVENYKTNNHVIKLINGDIYVKINKLTIVLTGDNKPIGKGLFQHSLYNAQYDKNKETIHVFNCALEYKPLEAKFNEQYLKHELIHYFDTADMKTSVVANKIDDKSYDEYVNSPLEINAHFFQIVMPSVLKQIKSANKLLPFPDFRKAVMEDHAIIRFFRGLNSNNQKRFLKRIGEY